MNRLRENDHSLLERCEILSTLRVAVVILSAITVTGLVAGAPIKVGEDKGPIGGVDAMPVIFIVSIEHVHYEIVAVMIVHRVGGGRD